MREPKVVPVPRTPASEGASGLLRWSLQLLWFAITPLTLSGVFLRYLTPYSITAGGFEATFAEFSREHTLLLGLGLFLLLAALFRYWRAFLPGGRYLFVLPRELVESVPRGRLALAEVAAAELDWLARADGQKAIQGAEAAIAARLTSAAQELREQLFAAQWRSVERAVREFQHAKQGVASAASFRSSLVFALALGATALLALQLRAHFFQAYEVLGSSMLPTFTPGELLLGKVATYSSANLPQRGEIVVLRVLVDGEPRDIVKRVFGLPGDHIGMSGNVPVVNGWPVPFCDAGPYFSPSDESAHSGDPSGRLFMEFVGNEAYLSYQTVFAEPFAEYVVKPGEVFVLGDNRSNSRDSRNFDGGAAHGFPLSAIRAKVTRVLLSRNARGQLDPASVWQPLDYSFRVEGTDMSVNQSAALRCLLLRPKNPTPPSGPKLSAASSSQ